MICSREIPWLEAMRHALSLAPHTAMPTPLSPDAVPVAAAAPLLPWLPLSCLGCRFCSSADLNRYGSLESSATTFVPAHPARPQAAAAAATTAQQHEQQHYPCHQQHHLHRGAQAEAPAEGGAHAQAPAPALGHSLPPLHPWQVQVPVHHPKAGAAGLGGATSVDAQQSAARLLRQTAEGMHLAHHQPGHYPGGQPPPQQQQQQQGLAAALQLPGSRQGQQHPRPAAQHLPQQQEQQERQPGPGAAAPGPAAGWQGAGAADSQAGAWFAAGRQGAAATKAQAAPWSQESTAAQAPSCEDELLACGQALMGLLAGEASQPGAPAALPPAPVAWCSLALGR